MPSTITLPLSYSNDKYATLLTSNTQSLAGAETVYARTLSTLSVNGYCLDGNGAKYADTCNFLTIGT